MRKRPFRDGTCERRAIGLIVIARNVLTAGASILMNHIIGLGWQRKARMLNGYGAKTPTGYDATLAGTVGRP